MSKWSRRPRICRPTWQPKVQRSCQENAGHTLQPHFFTIHINISPLIYHVFQQPLPVRFQCQTWVRIPTLINEIQSQHQSGSTGPKCRTTSVANWLSQAGVGVERCDWSPGGAHKSFETLRSVSPRKLPSYAVSRYVLWQLSQPLNRNVYLRSESSRDLHQTKRRHASHSTGLSTSTSTYALASNGETKCNKRKLFVQS